MAADTFNRADNADLGADWTPVGAQVFNINSNEARSPLTGDAGAEYYNPLSPGPAQYSTVTAGADVDTASTFGVGPCVRMATGADTSYWCAINTVDEYELYEVTAGSLTSLGSYTAGAAPAAGAVVRLEADATTGLEVFVGGVSRITATDATLSTGRVGIRGEAEIAFGSIEEWEGDETLFPSAAITGTATASITEADIVAGGKTVIVTLTDATWVVNTIVTPVIESGDCTVSGSNTAADPWTTVAYPNAVTGDLLIFLIAWDDSTTTTDVVEPAGPNGETLSEINATPVTDGLTETRLKGWYTVATGTWTAGNLSFNPSATESWSATCIRVPAGEFDSSTPIGAVGTSADSGGGTDTTVDSPAFTAGASDGDGKLVWCASVDADPLSGTNPTGWTIVQAQDLGAVAHGVATRNTAVTDSESISSATWSIAGDSWASLAFVVRAPTTTPFENARQAIIDGLDSAQAEGTGWNAEVRDNLATSTVARTSDTVCTVTLSAQAAYNITAQETITVTVPSSAISNGGPLTGSPTFTVATSGGGGGSAKMLIGGNLIGSSRLLGRLIS